MWIAQSYAMYWTRHGLNAHLLFLTSLFFVLEFSKFLKNILYILWILKKCFRLAKGQISQKLEIQTDATSSGGKFLSMTSGVEAGDVVAALCQEGQLSAAMQIMQ